MLKRHPKLTHRGARRHAPNIELTTGKPGVIRRVGRLHQRYLADDKGAILEALDACLRTGTKPPLWLAQAFCDHYTRWRRLRVKTLDAAFGVQRPKGQKFVDLSKREALKAAVTAQFYKLNAQRVTTGKDPDLDIFKRINRALGIGNAKDIFYLDDNLSNRKFIEALLKLPKGPPRKNSE
jgi:hypothetical protein